MPQTHSTLAIAVVAIRNKGSKLLRFGLLFNIVVLASACSSSDTPESNTVSPSVGEATQSPENESTGSGVPVHVLPETLPEESSVQNSTTDNINAIAPSEASCSADALVMQQRTLQLINEARAVARRCENDYYPAVNPLSWNDTLLAAASAHSMDMATHNFFSHTSSDGSSASMRITDAGYIWRTVGENIAAGRATAAQTINDWLDSPGHCRNIMNPNFRETAVSCIEDNDSDYRRYWTNVLAAPR